MADRPAWINENEGMEELSKVKFPSLENDFLTDRMSADLYVKGLDILDKSLGPPPQQLSYLRASTMPERFSSLAVMQWPGLPPESLRKIVRENIAPQIVLYIRTTDAVRYSVLSDKPWKPGWRIESKIPLDSLSEKDKEHELKLIREAEQFILNCNIETTSSEARLRDSQGYTNFTTFLSAIVRDSLTYDGMAVYTDMDKMGRVKAFAAIEAGLIRLVQPAVTDGKTEIEPDKMAFGNPETWSTAVGDWGPTDSLHVFENRDQDISKIYAVGVDEAGNIKQLFTRDDLIFYVRNPRVDPDIGKYGNPEIFDAMKIIQGYQDTIEMTRTSFTTSCFSEDTQVLTKDGWKTFDQVTLDDYVMTLNKETNTAEYQRPTQVIWEPYKGTMYELKSQRSVDMLVTPNHRIVYGYRRDLIKKGKYKIDEARDVYEHFKNLKNTHSYGIPATANWQGKEIGCKEFSYGRNLIGGFKLYEKTKKFFSVPDTFIISGDDYCAFMGMYLAEGCCLAPRKNGKKKSIFIAQKKESKGYEKYKSLLIRMFSKNIVQETEFGFYINSVSFCQHVSQYGTEATNKFIPDEIMQATREQIKLFLEYFILGDGTFLERESFSEKQLDASIVTTSKKMADQLQELAFKVGYSASVCIRSVEYMSQYKPSVIDGRQIIPKNDQYVITIRIRKVFSFGISPVEYDGHIGCVSVPNTIIYVRRNGKPGWSGNSIPNGILKLKGNAWTQRQIDVLQRIWVNLKRGITKSWALPVVNMPMEADMEVLDLQAIKGMEMFYQDWMNVSIGIVCSFYQIPLGRVGYRVSGRGPDTKMPPETLENPVYKDEYDNGKVVLLIHLENMINDYILSTRYPSLRFSFTGKTPSEDSREFEQRILAMTWKEQRKATGLPTLSSLASNDEEEKILSLMEKCPVDPVKVPVFQIAIQSFFGQQNMEVNGPPIENHKDPAKLAQHGHEAGVRRDSRSEKKK